MHIHFLDPYQDRSSPIHRLDSRVKLTASLAYIFTCAFIPTGAWPIFIILWSILVAAELLSTLPLTYYWKRSLLALPFALAALPLLFTVPVIDGNPLFQVSFASFTLIASPQGLVRLITVILKSWLSVQSAIWLTAVTPFPDLLQALRAAHIPQLLVSMVGLMWRYLFVLVDEAIRLLRARESRSGVSETGSGKIGGSLIWRAQVTGGMAGNLLLRSFERSDRIYTAMLSRGYDGESRNLHKVDLPVRQRWLLITLLAVFVSITLIAQLFGQ